MTREEILEDIRGLDKRLYALEQTYGMRSEDMYTRYRSGELEQSRDSIRWVGYYELKQERQHSETGKGNLCASLGLNSKT